MLPIELIQKWFGGKNKPDQRVDRPVNVVIVNIGDLKRGPLNIVVRPQDR